LSGKKSRGDGDHGRLPGETLQARGTSVSKGKKEEGNSIEELVYGGEKFRERSAALQGRGAKLLYDGEGENQGTRTD